MIKKLPKIIQDNLIVYLEAARVALADADTFEDLIDKMDIEDSKMKELSEALNDFMNKQPS